MLEAYVGVLDAMARQALPTHLRAKLDTTDVVQEVLLRAHQSGGSFEGRTEPERLAYLRAIFATTLADQIRRFDRSKREAARERSMDGSADQPELWLAADHTSPSGRARRNEQVARLAEAMATLSKDQRRAVELHHLQGRTLQETATTMGRTPEAVAGLLRRGLASLRLMLRE